MELNSQYKMTSNRRAFALFILTVVFVFNFIDRQIIGIVSPFIKDEMGLTDSQLGLLKGIAFALLYTILAIPIAWLADRYNRVRIVSASLAIWSLFTAFTGLANSFLTLLAARIGVGVGEAGGSPASHSIISDLYPKAQRATALSIFALGVPIGIMFAYFAAGQFINTLGWRGTLIALAVPGVVLAIIMVIFVREPERGVIDGITQSVTPAPKFKETLKFLFSIPSWWVNAVGFTLSSFGGYAIVNWGVDYVVRWDPSFKEPENFTWLVTALGLAYGIAYGIGTFGGGYLADRLSKKSEIAYALVPGIALCFGVPALVFAFWAPNIILHLAGLTVFLIAGGACLGPCYAVAQSLAPVRMRAMSIALTSLFLNLIALGGGPWFVGIASQILSVEHGEAHGLRLAITWLVVPYVLAILTFICGSRFLPRDLKKAESQIGMTY